ncbi:hypothetical protein C8Q80DRAFT_1110645 [Daedaleopsis nitida]|nr:hypothetical protein C8Q80DRAFT_1110645 [Daedaleopsis nitida]
MPLLFQTSYYVVNNVNAVLYGVELVLYFLTIQQWRYNRAHTSWDTFLVGMNTVQLVLITIYWTTQVYFGQEMWIVHSGYPGGIDAYLAANVAVWYQTWGSAAVQICVLMTDLLLINRLYIIWDSRTIVIVPLILWTAQIAFTIGGLYEAGRPDGNYFAGVANIFGTSRNAVTFTTNVTVTALICARIIITGRRLKAINQDASVHTGAVAVVIESALPFTVFNLVYIITFALKSDIAIAFSFHSMFTCISPQMITLRVLRRRAWTREIRSRYLTSIQFNEPPNPSGESSTQVSGDPDKVDVELGELGKVENQTLADSSTSALTDGETSRKGGSSRLS